MSRRFLSVCALLSLLAVFMPISLPRLVEGGAAAPIDPASSNATCLYIPPTGQSNSASSTAWQFEPSMPTPRHSCELSQDRAHFSDTRSCTVAP
jgi:hypothetical protein